MNGKKYNPQNRPVFEIIDPKYVQVGETGYLGNDFGDHVALHFPDGSMRCFEREALRLVFPESAT